MFVSIRSLRKCVLPLVVALAIAGCGGDDDDNSASAPETTATSTSETTSTTSSELEPRTETLPDGAAWPLAHPVPSALIACGLILAAAVPLTLWRFRVRTSG